MHRDLHEFCIYQLCNHDLSVSFLGLGPLFPDSRASLIAHLVKNSPAVQETLVQFLGWEDPLEKGNAIHSNILGLPLWLSW